MNKTILMFKHEFLLSIKRAGYIILTLIIPVLALLAIGIFQLIKTNSGSPENRGLLIGYVDESGLMDETVDEGNTRFILYGSKEDANLALTSMEIPTYIIIHKNYLSSGTIQRFTLEKETTSKSLNVLDYINIHASFNTIKNNLNKCISSINSLN